MEALTNSWITPSAIICPLFLIALGLAAKLGTTDVAQPEMTSAILTQNTDCQTRFRTVIDVGHGSDAPGAISARGRTEFEFNRRLGQRIASELWNKGYHHTFLVVTSGNPLNLATRAKKENSINPDLLLSVHHDSVQPSYLQRWTFNGQQHKYSDKFHGFSIFVSRLNPRFNSSVTFARMVADKFLKRGMNFTLHHHEPIAGENKALIDEARGIYEDDPLKVLALSHSPAILVEFGIIVNRDEEMRLSQPWYQATLAEAVAEAVQNFCLNSAY